MAKLTQERANKITDFLNADEARARSIMALGPDEALTQINGGLGMDFAKEEILEYGELLKRAALSDDALEGVAGGTGGGDMEEHGPITIALLTAGAKKAAPYVIGGAVTWVANNVPW